MKTPRLGLLKARGGLRDALLVATGAAEEEAGKRLGAFNAYGNDSIDPRTLSSMPAHYSTSNSYGGKTIAPVVNQNGNFYSYDPTQIARDIVREQKRGLALTNLKGLVR